MDTPTLLPDREATFSAVGLGCNNFGMKLDAEQSAQVVHAALDAGVTHFDTAEIYGQGRSEEYLGAALAERRDQAFIATKFSPRPPEEPYRPGALADRVRTGCDASLQRLGTDHIDLYYQHYPDPDAPLDELASAFQQLVEAGKVRHVGFSNAPVAQLDAAGAGVAALQVEWNLLARDVEAEIVPAAVAHDIGVVPYFPLASGLLTGKYRKGEAFPEGSRLDALPYFRDIATDANLDRVERLRDLAAANDRSLLELAVAWLASQPAVVSVICGATSPRQVQANAAAASWRLDDETLAHVDRCLR